MRNLFIITILGLAVPCNVWAQPNKPPAKSAPFFDEADALLGKRKAKRTTNVHDKYANQEVSYRQNPKVKNAPAKRNAIKPKTTQVTHDPEFEQWASLKRKRKTR